MNKQRRSISWLNSDIILRLMDWIHNIFSYIFRKKSDKIENKRKEDLTKKLEDAKAASVEGNADKVNLLVEELRKNKIVESK